MGLLSVNIEEVKDEGGWETGLEMDEEPAGLSEETWREEVEAFLRGRLSKERGRGEGRRDGEMTGSGEASFAFRLPPKTVLEVPEATGFSTMTDFPDLIGVPTLGNEHFFLW
jgi:hypothetical protein